MGWRRTPRTLAPPLSLPTRSLLVYPCYTTTFLSMYVILYYYLCSPFCHMTVFCWLTVFLDFDVIFLGIYRSHLAPTVCIPLSPRPLLYYIKMKCLYLRKMSEG